MAKRRGSDDDDRGHGEGRDRRRRRRRDEHKWAVCPTCVYSEPVKDDAPIHKKKCPKCGSKLVGSSTKGKISLKDLVDHVEDVCREIRGE